MGSSTEPSPGFFGLGRTGTAPVPGGFAGRSLPVSFTEAVGALDEVDVGAGTGSIADGAGGGDDAGGGAVA
mgnify:CR=1 FL=1